MTVNWDMSEVDYKQPGDQPDYSLQPTCRHTDYAVSVAIPVETDDQGMFFPDALHDALLCRARMALRSLVFKPPHMPARSLWVSA